MRPEIPGPRLSEAEVEEMAVDLFRATAGMVLACYSTQNIDRLVTMHRAARRAGRKLVLDLYGSEVARATGRPDTIPQGDWGSVHVYVPRSQRALVKRAGEFGRVDRIRSRRLFPHDLTQRADNLVMTFRASMREEMDRAGCLGGAAALWSMWPSYLDQPSGSDLQAWFETKGIPLSVLHSSGHADVSDLQRFAAAIHATEVVPVHTRHADFFADLFTNVHRRRNGERWRI